LRTSGRLGPEYLTKPSLRELSSCRQGEFFLLATEVTDPSAVHDELVNTKKLVKTTRTLTEEKQQVQHKHRYSQFFSTINFCPRTPTQKEAKVFLV
jgi:hypothetical protein